uniref:RNase H family protein n=1 Tax=Solanum tuberosum TaxID=4113 RepID=M1DFI8_SOLTU
MNVDLNLNIDDRPIWTPTQNGSFTMASAWEIQRQRNAKSWFDSSTWCKKVPLKMSFILWRVVRDRIPTDSRLTKMGIAMSSRCCCCKSPQKEDVDHFSCSGEFEKKIWSILCGPLGIPFDNIPIRMLIKFWWTWKTKNPVLNMLMKCLPAITLWEVWKARCGDKYSKDYYNTKKTINNISTSLVLILKGQFEKIKVDPDWESVRYLLISNISNKRIVQVKWLNPSNSFVKINSDGSCKDGYCGGGGVIRDHRGHLIFAYSLNLGHGTNNWAEAKALLYGVEWCVRNEYDYTLAESDSKVLVDCVNDINSIPWRIYDEVRELKAHMETTGFILSHCYREANKVADHLASLSYDNPNDMAYDVFAELPTRVKGLMNMDRWEMTNFRTMKKKRNDLIWEPP